MSEMNIPEWVDRRTAEWCATVCDHVAARLLFTHRQGAEACATQIRAVMTLKRPLLPALRDLGLPPEIAEDIDAGVRALAEQGTPPDMLVVPPHLEEAAKEVFSNLDVKVAGQIPEEPDPE